MTLAQAPLACFPRDVRPIGVARLIEVCRDALARHIRRGEWDLASAYADAILDLRATHV